MHPGQGTRNALLGLEDDTYIEIIAPDPAQPADLPLSQYLASRSSPALSWWCARCEELEALQDAIRDAGLDAGSIDPWSRKRPDGEDLSWRLLMPNVPEFGASLPFFISWDDMALHPSRHVPAAGRLEKLVVSQQGADVLEELLGVAAEIRADAAPALSAEIALTDAALTLRTPETFPPAIGEIIRRGT